MIIPVNLGINSYDVAVGKGLLESCDKMLDLDRKVAVITDEGVPTEYGMAIKNMCGEAYIITVPQGEESKSLSALEMIISTMLEKGFTRQDCVIAVGGGVVGDLAGFAASVYMRGVDFYNIPTTVLSQVDSSIGGKTAVNFNGVKNIVGTFYQPKKVIIDPDVLKTLTKRQISNGLCEALKMASTFDKELFDVFENGDPYGRIDEIIEKALQIKANIVSQDEKESGIRKALNFGHTIGHGIESVKSGDGMLHGECVGIGMLAMCSDNVKDRLKSALKKLGVNVNITFDAEKAFDAAIHDKKSQGSYVTAVLCEEIGSFKFTRMDFDELKRRIYDLSHGGDLN
ncbi:MAG: 3-dehydroquinate synthase [Clostridiales bacterium]|nr:3-dehydroquinate synthase [Clostridiales bacterium]